MMDTILIGCFSEIYGDNYPSIRDCMNNDASENKQYVLEYLKKGRVIAASPAYLLDVLTGERIQMKLTSMTDGEFEWRSDLIYYYKRYNVDLPSEFIEKALAAKRS